MEDIKSVITSLKKKDKIPEGEKGIIKEAKGIDFRR